MTIMKYICDKEKHIKDGLCEGHIPNCNIDGNCFMTSHKEYAKDYITIYEAEKLFKEMADYYSDGGDFEKAKQYQNTLKSVEITIQDLKKESEEKDSVFVDCLCNQLDYIKYLLGENND